MTVGCQQLSLAELEWPLTLMRLLRRLNSPGRFVWPSGSVVGQPNPPLLNEEWGVFCKVAARSAARKLGRTHGQRSVRIR